MPHHWILLACLLILWVLTAISTIRTGQLLRRWTPTFNLLLSLPENALRLALIGLCVALGMLWGPGTGPLGWRIEHALPEAGWGAGVGVLLGGALLAGGQIAVRRWGPDVHDDTLLRAILPRQPREWPGVLAALLPAAALEELLFRSLPLGGLAWLLPAQWLLWPLALCFGLLHWPQGGWGVAGATLAGIAFGLLFLATGNIWAPLAAHYVMNVVQIVAAKALSRKVANL